MVVKWRKLPALSRSCLLMTNSCGKTTVNRLQLHPPAGSRMRTSRLHHPASIRLLSKVIQPALLRTRTDHLLNPPGFIQFSSNLASFHPPGIHSLVQQESSMSSPHLQNHLQSKQIHHPAPHFLNL